MFIPGFDPASGMFTLPWWAVALGAAVFVILLIDTAVRNNVLGLVALGLRVAIVMLIGWVAWLWIERAGDRDRADERVALQSRALSLAMQSAMPGSPLACLDATAGDAVEISCERALFAGPDTAATGTSYVATRLALLADITDYSARAGMNPDDVLPGLQTSLAADRYGFVAQVLATRDGCTAEKCETFTLFRDAGRLRANLQERTFSGYVARNSAAWHGAPTPPAPIAGLPPMASPLIPSTTAGISPVPPGFNLPSAASIPPVSIMTPEPGSPQPGAVGAPTQSQTAPAARRPAARKQSQSRSAPAAAPPPPPVQISPPAGAGTPPRAQ